MSLEVQWLRLHTPNAGGPGSILARELDLTCRNKDGRSHMSQLRPSTVKYIIKKKNEMQEPLPLFNTFILLGRCMQRSPLRLFLISFDQSDGLSKWDIVHLPWNCGPLI